MIKRKIQKKRKYDLFVSLFSFSFTACRFFCDLSCCFGLPIYKWIINKNIYTIINFIINYTVYNLKVKKYSLFLSEKNTVYNHKWNQWCKSPMKDLWSQIPTLSCRVLWLFFFSCMIWQVAVILCSSLSFL